MSDYCTPPVSQLPPGLRFYVHEEVVDNILPPGSNTFNANLGPFVDPVAGPITNFFSYSANTINQTKTLSLVGPKVPIKITWTHHSVSGIPPFTDTTTTDFIILDEASTTYTWPTGTSGPGGSEYDASFVGRRVV